MDTIRIHELELDCIVGLRPDERRCTQRVRLDLAFEIDTRRAGRSGKIAQTCDYDDVTEEVIALLRFRRYRLIEVATEELCAMLLGNHPQVHSVRVRLEKPGALAGRARAASIEASRDRADYEFRPSTEGHGSRLTLLDTREAELSILTLDAGRTYQPESGPHRDLHMPVSGDILCQTRLLTPFRVAAPDQLPASYTTAPEREQPSQLFRCRAWPQRLT